MEDLLVQMDKLIVPFDFVVLEIVGALLQDKENTIFLQRPFMATTKTIIDVQNGKLLMMVLGETVQFKVFNSLPYPSICSHDECSFIDCIDSLVHDGHLQENVGDELQAALTIEVEEDNMVEEVEVIHESLDSAKILEKESMEPTALPNEEPATLPSPELKELPEHLKYVFLGEGKTHPVIISSQLTQGPEKEVVQEGYWLEH